MRGCPRHTLPWSRVTAPCRREHLWLPDDHDDLGGLRAALEAVLRSTDDEQQIADVADSAGIIEDLPLWTSRWTALPGFMQARLAFAAAPFWAAVCQHTHERVA